MINRRTIARVVVAGSCLVAGMTVMAPARTILADSGPASSAVAGPPATLVPVRPCRLLDTRQGARLAGGSTIDVGVHGRCDIPSSADSVAVTLTAIDPDQRGYLTMWSSGAVRPSTSSLNYAAGGRIGNLQLVRLGEAGRLSVFTRAPVDVVVDVTAYFQPVSGPTTVGRFVPVGPSRALDTRERGRPRAGTAVRVSPDVPNDATAVAVTVATTEVTGPGYFSAYAAGTSRPATSILNADRPGQTRAASAIVPMSDDGIEIYTHGGDHVIVDITGYFTGPSADASHSGLFVAALPTRAVDTRAAGSIAGGPRIWDHGTREFDLTPITGREVAAVALNIAVTDTEDRGHATAFPARTDRPRVSTVNYDAAQMTISAASLSAVSSAGLAVHATEAIHLVLDVTGWFTGAARVASGPEPVNEPPPDRRVTIIGDSAFAGMRWNATLAGLQGMVVDDRLESCRRLVVTSCRGREGYRPRTVRAEIARLTPGPEDLLVVAAGYDDWHGRFADDFDVLVAEARARGFRHIAWITYRSDVGYSLPSGGRSNYAEMNLVLRRKTWSGDHPEVRVWDYDTYTSGSAGWFSSDGIHQRPLGSWATADFLAREVAAFDDKPCPQPWAPGLAVDVPCPSPVATRSETGSFPDIVGVYGLGDGDPGSP